MIHAEDLEEERLAEGLLAELRLLTGRPCPGCARPVCGHEVLFSVAMGAKDAPRCLGCLAILLQQSTRDLSEHLTTHFQQRPCYGKAWRTACQAEGQDESFQPVC
ncbi:MAG: hypothetical protein ACKO23_03890, partial [Gemmataceae bacterium]